MGEAVDPSAAEMAGPRPGRPLDECPYPRPFPVDFNDCPAFRAVEFIGLDMQYKPLAPVFTCQHLVPGTIDGIEGRTYGRCVLGPPRARARWLQRVTPERLQVIDRFGRELREVLRPHIHVMWEAKGELLRGDGGPAAEARLDEALHALIRDCEHMIDENEVSLARVGFPAAPVKELIRLALEDWRQSSARVYRFEMTDSMLSRFTPEVRQLLRPAPRPPAA